MKPLLGLVALAFALLPVGAHASPPAGRTFVVRMTDRLQFAPAKLTIRVGDRVVWRNVGRVAIP